MTAWANAEVLIELLERQRDQVLQFEHELRIFALSRWLRVLTSDAQLAALIRELLADYKLELDELSASDAKIRDFLQSFWSNSGQLILQIFHDRGWNGEAIASAYCPLDEFEERVKKRIRYAFRSPRLFDEDSSQTAKLAQALKHWSIFAIQKFESLGTEPPEEVLTAKQTGELALANITYIQRCHSTIHESSPGAAFKRLSSRILEANQRPPELAMAESAEKFEEQAWLLAFFARGDAFSDKVHGFNSARMRRVEGDEVSSAAVEIAYDIRTVTHELTAKLLTGRSRLALIKRYAAQCEAFDSDELRNLVANSKGSVEQQLTLRFAKYLFEQGLNPILNPDIGGLKPDVVAVLPGSMLYVEAKQYGATFKRTTILNAYQQVWGTWATLRQQSTIHEAFLLVFRVAGPRVELPEVLTHDGRKLYSVLVDISAERGSAERKQPVTFGDAELLPRGGDS